MRRKSPNGRSRRARFDSSETIARAQGRGKSVTKMSERHGAGHGLNEHELSEIRMLIEERTGIHFDESRERFFSTRVREHLHDRGFTRGQRTAAGDPQDRMWNTKRCWSGC